MKLSILSHIIPRTVTAVPSTFSPTAPIPDAIFDPSKQSSGFDDDTHVITKQMPGERFDSGQLLLDFNGEGVDTGEMRNPPRGTRRSPEEHLALVRSRFEAARSAVEKEDWRGASQWYHLLHGALVATIDGESSRPTKFFRHFHGGEDLYVEAAIGAAVFASDKTADTMLDYLGHVRDYLLMSKNRAVDAELDVINSYLARIKVARAFTMMRYADNIDELEALLDQKIAASLESLACVCEGKHASGLDKGFELGIIGGAGIEARHEFYENAERKVRAAVKLIERDVYPEASAVSKFLLVDLVARQADCSYWRGDAATIQKDIAGKLEQAALDLMDEFESSKSIGAKAVASYMVDVAKFFVRIGSKTRALRIVRKLLDGPPELVQSREAQDLFAVKEFEDLVDDSRKRIRSNYELKLDRSSQPILSRGKAALANAESEGFVESAAVNTAGAIVGGGLAHALGADPQTILATALGGAALARMGMSVWNGWTSEEARSVGEIGIYDRPLRNVIGDVGRLIGHGAFNALVTTPVAAAGVYASEWIPMAKSTFPFAWHFFTDAMYDAETYKNASIYPPANTPFHDFLWYFARPLSAASGAFYLTYLAAPQGLRDKQAIFANRNYVWPLLLTGSLLLSADLSTIIAGKTDYFDRIWRGGIGIMAASAMLMMGGVIALRNTGSPREFVSSIWNGFGDLNKMNLVAVAIMTGVSSSIGGHVQNHVQKEVAPDNALMKLVLGAMINVAILPLPIIISGTFKRYFTPFRGAAEGWQDAKGEGMPRQFYEAGKGFLASFWLPYILNRAGRASLPWFDWVGAGIRGYLIWDGNPGTAVMSAYNVATVDSVGTMTWKETGNTDWEREAFRDMSAPTGNGRTADITSELYDHWRKAGQRLSPFHMFYPHAVRDRLWSLSAIRRVWSPPKFPLYPDAHYFSGFLQQLMGKHKVELSEAALNQILQHVRCLAMHPRNYAVMRPVVQTLYAARAVYDERVRNDAENAIHPLRLRLRRFFEHHPSMLDLLNIDRSKLVLPDDKHRSALKIWAIRNLTLTREEYTKRVLEHRALKDRVHDENTARKEARTWAKQQVGDYGSRLRDLIAEQLNLSDAELWERAYEECGDQDADQSKGDKGKQRYDKRINSLASRMAKLEKGTKAEKQQRRVDLESYLRELSPSELWAQELSIASPRRAAKLRTKKAVAIARVILRKEQDHLRVKKEMELLQNVTDKYADEKKKRPIHGLFEEY